MTLDEATAHLGNPVLIHTGPGRVTDAEIVAVDVPTRQVGLRVRRKSMPYDFLHGTHWWTPQRLSIPQWWVKRRAS